MVKTAKYISVIALFLAFSTTFTAKSYAQDEMDYDEFMGMLSNSFTEKQLDEMSFQLPWDVKVCGYAYGDFSGDGYDDIIISAREKDVTPANTVDVFILESTGFDSYKLVEKKNFKYYELTLEVAFLVKDGTCYITNRDNGNWYFTSYQINEKKKFVQLDKETYPIDFEKAGN